MEISVDVDVCFLFFISAFSNFCRPNCRIVLFEPECLKSDTVSQSYAPSLLMDPFGLVTIFFACISASASSSVRVVAMPKKIMKSENFIENLGVFDNGIDARNPRWSTHWVFKRMCIF